MMTCKILIAFLFGFYFYSLDTRNNIFRNTQNCCKHLTALQWTTQITIPSTISMEIIFTNIEGIKANRSSHITFTNHRGRQQ